ncbi:hypothetical protein Btru_037853 [Bulinus truncatus]|nr:hypothetical protein Btru_037853 [Bulinus truncatus]
MRTTPYASNNGNGNSMERLLSTGVLAPTTLPLTHKDYNNTIEIIFATYWFFPTKTQAILQQDQKCIADKLAKEGIVRLDPESPYYQMNHDEYEYSVTAECIKISNHQLTDKDIYSNVNEEYNPFDLRMGQMTVYRLRLKLTCSQKMNNSQTVKCSTILPYTHQRWSGYMGSNGDSHWRPPYH